MLYYDLMVKLANTDMGALFNVTANLEQIDEDEQMREKLMDRYPKLNTSKNLHETLVDAYLLHFLGEMDPKMLGKDREYMEMLENGKTDQTKGKVDHMGKLESMRELMKKKGKIDAEKSGHNLNVLLGNMVKRKIMQKKLNGMGEEGQRNGGSQRKGGLYVKGLEDDFVFQFLFVFVLRFFSFFLYGIKAKIIMKYISEI